jgi:hypothetical protein
MSGIPRSITARTSGVSERDAMHRLVAARLDHPDRVAIVNLPADHIQVAAVCVLQLPDPGHEQRHELVAPPGMRHELANHAWPNVAPWSACCAVPAC